MTKRSSNSNGHSGTRAKTLVARKVKRADYEGVQIVSPRTTYIEPGVAVGPGTIIHPNTTISGKTSIGAHCRIGPNSIVVDSQIGDEVTVFASVVERAVIESGADVGPFSHLRPGAHLEKGVHIGNFVEVKASRIGASSRAGHFSYIGDAKVGKDVNIGAGTVTCNYDGATKHQTVIGDGSFIGSDTMLVLIAGIIVFILVVAAEAGIIAGMREQAMREPAESRVEALRRFYHERQLTLSSLTLARNLALVGVTAIVVFLVLREWSDSWLALAITTIAVAAAFLLLQAFPRALVTQDPTGSRKALAPIVNFIRVAFRLPVLILDAPMGAVLRTWQRRQAAIAGGAEELILLIEMEQASASLHEDERQMIRGVIELEFTSVREVMVPRTDIVAVEVSTPFERTAALMVEHGFSRLPVYEENLDNIVGIVHGKEVMKHLANGDRQPGLRDLMRPPHFVPESKKVHELLAEMREKQLSIAIVVDEYGGTAGLVTIEDLLEEIVGEIRDEFDVETEQIVDEGGGSYVFSGKVGFDEVRQRLAVAIEREGFETVGGYLLSRIGRVPAAGEKFEIDGLSVEVLDTERRRVNKVRFRRSPSATEAAEDAEEKTRSV